MKRIAMSQQDRAAMFAVTLRAGESEADRKAADGLTCRLPGQRY